MALFGSKKYRTKTTTRSTGVSTAQRAARARKGHQRRAAHLYTGGNPKRGTKTSYRKGGGHLF